jgi:hypothetical protein
MEQIGTVQRDINATVEILYNGAIFHVQFEVPDYCLRLREDKAFSERTMERLTAGTSEKPIDRLNVEQKQIDLLDQMLEISVEMKLLHDLDQDKSLFG